MEITYRNNFWDHLYFNLHVLYHSKVSLILLGLMLFLVGRLALDVAVEIDSFGLAGKLIGFSLVLVVGFSIYILLMLILIFISVFFSSRTYRAKWGECQIQLTENMLLAKSSVMQSEVQWAAIEDIKQTKGLILISITRGMAYLIPKRAFKNEAAASEFFARTNELWQQHKHPSSIDQSPA